MYTNTIRQTGFTLMELLTVIAIIGILSAVTISTYSGARERARDTQRITELGQLALALERYFDACNQYPGALDPSESAGCPSGVTFGTFAGNPVPKNIDGSDYLYDSDGTAFVLSVQLEQDNAVFVDNVGVPAGLSITGSCSSADFYYCLSS